MTAPRINYLAVGAGMLVIMAGVGVGTYFLAARKEAADGPKPGDAVAMTITATACEPNELTVPEGRTTFAITNKSNRGLEWEILQGVMVIEEKENILPSENMSPDKLPRLTARLEPGDYEITCGLLTNPRGKLHVTALANAPKQAAPSLVDLIGPLAEYKVYMNLEVDDLADATKAFTDAVKAGDLAKAQALYASTRQHYDRIKPVAELFSDLDKAIDARADVYEKLEADPNFTGFHRLEYGLFKQKNTDGLAPLADKLTKDVAELQGRVSTLAVPPEKMVGGAAMLMERVASAKVSGEEERYSHADLADIQANIEGTRKITDLLVPLTTKASAALQRNIDDNFAAVNAVLAKYKAPGGGFKPYDALTQDDRAALQKAVATLADGLSTLRGTLGLD